MIELKILHIGNTAGVASTLAYHMDRLYPTRSQVLQIRRNDGHNLTFYGKTTANNSAWFYLCSVVHALRADLIHVHSRGGIVPWLNRLGLGPILLHYHGTDIRGRWADPIRISQYSRADRIVVSTGDLMKEAPTGVLWLKCPINVDRFNRRPETPKPPARRAFTFSYGADPEARMIAHNYGIEVDVIPRTIPYSEMPALMARYTHFIEVKKVGGRYLPPARDPYDSLTSLEARSMGLTVLRFDGELEGLPDEYRPENAVNRFYELYLEMMEGRL